jgi:hypothetical protein
MRKILTALITATSISAATLATSSTADARWGRWGPGPVIGGLAAGAIIGSAIAAASHHHPYYVAYSPFPYYGPPCGYVWNGYRWFWTCV